MNGIMTGVNGALGKIYSTHKPYPSLDLFSWMEINAKKFDVVNISWSYPECLYQGQSAITFCYEEYEFRKKRALMNKHISNIKNINPNLVFVVAAGNVHLLDTYKDELNHPRDHFEAFRDVNHEIPPAIDKDNIITVGSVDSSGKKSWFSNLDQLDKIDIAAVGEEVYGPDTRIDGFGSWEGRGYSCQYGTSFSAPIVAGVIGLMKSIDSSLSGTEILEILQATGENTSADDMGFLLGQDVKMLNAARAVACVLHREDRNLIFDANDISSSLHEDIHNDASKPICGAKFNRVSVSTFANTGGWQSNYSSEGLYFYNVRNTSDDPTSGSYHGGLGTAIIQWGILSPLLEGEVYGAPIVISAANGKRIKSISFNGPSVGNWPIETEIKAYNYGLTPMGVPNEGPEYYIRHVAVPVFHESLPYLPIVLTYEEFLNTTLMPYSKEFEDGVDIITLGEGLVKNNVFIQNLELTIVQNLPLK